MRIVCEKCAAAYAIDDRLVTPRGVRAQCPRCRHQHLLTSASAFASPAGAAQLTEAGRKITPVATERIPEAAYPERRPAAPAIDAALAPPRMTPIASSGARGDQVSTPVAIIELAKMERRPEPPPRTITPSPAPGSTEGPATPDANATPRCERCGNVLEDAFDQALGVCDPCRARGSDPQAPVVAAPEPLPQEVAPAQIAPQEPASTVGRSSASPKWDRRVVVVAAVAAGLLLVAVVGWIAFARSDDVRKGPTAGTADGQQALPARLPRSAIGSTIEEAQRLLAQDDEPAYAVAAEKFAAVLRERPSNEAAMAGWVTALALGQGTRLPEAQRQEATTRLGEVIRSEGATPQLLLAQAHLLLTRPRAPGHQEDARRLATEALGLARDDAGKAAAQVALGRAAQVTSAALSQKSFDAALTLEPQNAVALTSRAAARMRAHDVGGAVADLESRLARDPKNGRAINALTRLFARAGRYEEARKRLAAAAEAMPDDARFPLALAAIGYQFGPNRNARAEAVQTLRVLTGEASLPTPGAAGSDDAEPAGASETSATEAAGTPATPEAPATGNAPAALTTRTLPPSLRREALLHLAIAERVTGNRAEAIRHAQWLLEEDGADPAARLALLLAALESGDASLASAQLAGVQGRLEDAALEQLLEGRVRLLEGKAVEAERALRKSVELDPRRTDARLWAGLAALSGDRREEAVRQLQLMAGTDPLRPPPGLEDPLLFIAPWELVRGAQLDSRALSSGRDDLLPALYDAVLRYHQGDASGALKSVSRVVTIDPGNGLAQGWRTFAALRAGDLRTARLGSDAAKLHGRTLGMALMARGLVHARDRQPSEARRALTEALAADRGLLGAELELARLDLQAGDRDAAKDRALRVLRADPENAAARGVLLDVAVPAGPVGANR